MGQAASKKSANRVVKADRGQLINLLERYNKMSNDWLRRQIIQHNRIDILAIAILGYQVQPFHLAMLQYQFLHPVSMQLVFRGAGKTTLCTVTKTIHYLLKDPNLRILLASKTAGNSEDFLKEIKGHFENNERLAEVFGQYYDTNRCTKWDNRKIEVLPRTTTSKEASITCVGTDSTIVSKHYDVIMCDDLVDEENARTKHMRDKVKTWYYQTLDPCLEPPSLDVPCRGEQHHLGTRYHFEDLWGHLQANELKKHTQIFPAINSKGQTPWPKKYSLEWLKKKKRKAGVIIFNAQYQCDTESMKGEVFQYDNCQMIDSDELPKKLRIYIGTDLAVSQQQQNDKFALVVIGEDPIAGSIFVLYAYTKQLRFRQQTKKAIQIYDKYNPVRHGVEAQQYQGVFYQELQDIGKDEGNFDRRFQPVFQTKDKHTRAWKLTAIFEDKRVFFVKGAPGIQELIDQLVLFPNHSNDDLFDGLDIAVNVRKKRRIHQERENEPGLI